MKEIAILDSRGDVARREVAEVQRPEPASAGAAFLDVIAQAARDPQVDVAKMQQLLEMRERIMRVESEMAFNAAMARLQPRLPIITKRGKISFQGKDGKRQDTPFARYEDIDLAIRPLLCEEGFSLSFGSRPTEKGVEYYGELSHAAGHKKTSSMILPADTSGSKNAIQAIGSTVSYAKRYIVGMLLNIVTRGADDDGIAAGYVSDDQISKIREAMNACGLDGPRTKKFLEFAGAKSVEEIQAHRFDDVMARLNQVLRKQQEGK